MIDTLILANRYGHIVLGFVGLCAFWVPVLTRKGGQRHKLFGKIFAACAYIVGGTAVVGVGMRFGQALSNGAELGANPESVGFLLFLGYLGIVTVGITHQSVQAVRTRRDPDAIRTPFLQALAVAMALGSLAVIAYSLLVWTGVSIILLLLSPVGLVGSHGIFKYMYRRPPEKMAWWYEHMGAMLGAGIAFHTAFLVFGSRTVLDLSVLGPFNWVPWVLPGVIGTIGGGYWERFYRRKFGDLPSKGEAELMA